MRGVARCVALMCSVRVASFRELRAPSSVTMLGPGSPSPTWRRSRSSSRGLLPFLATLCTKLAESPSPRGHYLGT